MSYEQKGVWVYLVVSLGTFLGYVAAVVLQASGGPITEVAYLPILLWAIGISIVASIVGRITVEMAVRSDSYRVDARDKDVNRLGESAAGGVLGTAMVVPFVLALLEVDHFWIANAIYTAFVVWAVVGSVIKLVAYRRGF